MARPLLPFVLLATVVVMAPAHAAARAAAKPPSAEERSLAFVADGDAAYERGDYEEAITKYRAAYYGLGPEQRASYIGSLPVRNAMRAYALLLAERQDRTVLERQLAFLAEFLESVAAQADGAQRVGPEALTELEAVRDDVQHKLAMLSQAVAPPPDTQAGPTTTGDPLDPPPHDPPPHDPPPHDAPLTDSLHAPPPRDWLGLGLLIGGGATAGIGLGVTSGWWTVRRQAEREADRVYGSGPSPVRTQYLTDEWHHARRYLIAGSVLATLGLATAGAGVVHILVRRARSRDDVALGLGPALGPTTAGLRLHGRF